MGAAIFGFGWLSLVVFIVLFWVESLFSLDYFHGSIANKTGRFAHTLVQSVFVFVFAQRRESGKLCIPNHVFIVLTALIWRDQLSLLAICSTSWERCTGSLYILNRIDAEQREGSIIYTLLLPSLKSRLSSETSVLPGKVATCKSCCNGPALSLFLSLCLFSVFESYCCCGHSIPRRCRNTSMLS